METEHFTNNSFVYLVQHVRDNIEETSKIIGIYSNKSEAELAIRRLSLKSGFKDYKKDFYIDKYKINEDNWSEGFGF